MSQKNVNQAVIDTDDSLQKSRTHSRPEPKTQAPQSRPGSNGNNGSTVAPGKA